MWIGEDTRLRMRATSPLSEFSGGEFTIAPDLRSARARAIQQWTGFDLASQREVRPAPQSVQVRLDAPSHPVFFDALLSAPLTLQSEK